MPGWLELTLADGSTLIAETPGESVIDIAKNGYPRRLAFGELGLVAVTWTAENPSPDPEPQEGPPAEGEVELALNEEGAV